MTVETVKSGSITNLDASPMVVNTAGFGGVARANIVDGAAVVTTAKTAPSLYKLVRVRTTAVVKGLRVKTDTGVTTLSGDVGFYYSTGTADGTPPAKAGTVVGTGQEFGAGVDFSNHEATEDLTDNLTAAQLDMEAWVLAGLASDPGGFFDITVTTNATNSGSTVLYAQATIVDG